MAQLKRTVHLKITDPNGVVLLDDEQLRIDFDVKEMIGDQLDTATINIYNLARETVARISAKPKSKVQLRIKHHHSNSYTTIFGGVVVNSHATSMFEDHITTIYCWADGVAEGRTCLFSSSWPQGISIETILGAIIADLNRCAGRTVYSKPQYADGTVAKAMQTIISSAFMVNAKPHYEAIQMLLDLARLTFSKSGSILKIFQIPDKKGMEGKLLSEGSKVHNILPVYLRKPVVFGIADATISYSLSENIHPCDLVRLKPAELQTSVGGYDETSLQLVTDITKLVPNNLYYLMSVRHRGSAYTNDWDTELSGIIYSDGVGGVR